MRNKRNIGMEKMVLEIKEMKKYFFVPFIIIFILQPIYMSFKLKAGYGTDLMYVEDEIISEAVRLHPVLSLWWPFFVLTKYLENEDREIYYLYGRIKWDEIFNFYKLYMIAVFVWILFCLTVIDVAMICYLYIFLMAVCFFYIAFTYWLSYFVKSATVVLLPILLYSFWVTMGSNNAALYAINYIRIFSGGFFFRGVLKSLILAAVGIAFVFLGKRENIKYIDY